MFNEDTLKGKWKDIKGEIKTHWGEMTDDELEKNSGNLTSIAGLIQQRYGAKKEEIQEKLQSIVARFSHKTKNLKDGMREDQSTRE